MRLVWAADGPLTVKDMYDALRAQRKLAYTTAMSVCVKLAEKGLLRRELIEGNQYGAYKYTPLIGRQQLIVERVEHLLASMGVDEVERQYVAREIRNGRARV